MPCAAQSNCQAILQPDRGPGRAELQLLQQLDHSGHAQFSHNAHRGDIQGTAQRGSRPHHAGLTTIIIAGPVIGIADGRVIKPAVHHQQTALNGLRIQKWLQDGAGTALRQGRVDLTPLQRGKIQRPDQRQDLPLLVVQQHCRRIRDPGQALTLALQNPPYASLQLRLPAGSHPVRTAALLSGQDQKMPVLRLHFRMQEVCGAGEIPQGQFFLQQDFARLPGGEHPLPDQQLQYHPLALFGPAGIPVGAVGIGALRQAAQIARLRQTQLHGRFAEIIASGRLNAVYFPSEGQAIQVFP